MANKTGVEDALQAWEGNSDKNTNAEVGYTQPMARNGCMWESGIGGSDSGVCDRWDDLWLDNYH